MIREVQMFTVECDRCKKEHCDESDSDYRPFSDTAEGARELADYEDWVEIDGKDYCFTCYEYDDETDEYKVKEGE